MFRDLLNRKSQQQQLATLNSQVTELKAVNETLKKYLEAVMNRVSPDDSSRLIASEEKRLEEVKRNEKIRENRWYNYVMDRSAQKLPFDVFVEAMKRAKTFDEFVKTIAGKPANSNIREDLLEYIKRFSRCSEGLQQNPRTSWCSTHFGVKR